MVPDSPSPEPNNPNGGGSSSSSNNNPTPKPSTPGDPTNQQDVKNPDQGVKSEREKQLEIAKEVLADKIGQLAGQLKISDPNSQQYQEIKNELQRTVGLYRSVNNMLKGNKGQGGKGFNTTTGNGTDEENLGAEIAEYAASLAGSKYVSGGSEPGGVDCRDTVYYSYRKAGVDIENKDAQGYNDMMREIDKDDLKPGDIITYSNSKEGGRITHVQVYIGEGTDKRGNKVNDAVINASPTNGLYIVSLSEYNSWSDVNDHMTPHYGRLLNY